MPRPIDVRRLGVSALLLLSAACSDSGEVVAPGQDIEFPPVAIQPFFAVGAPLEAFSPLATSATCTVDGGNPSAPLVLPAGYSQSIIATEPSFQDLPDMNTLNESGPEAGRYLYAAHEVGSNGSVSRLDLLTGDVSLVAQRSDWERLDGIVWSPWGTIITAEESKSASLPDPAAPNAVGGMVYEIDPRSGRSRVLPLVGSRSHEGLRFDTKGNLYGISETSPGYIYKFVPTFPGDLTQGQLYALKVIAADGDRTGRAVWSPLDMSVVPISSDSAAALIGATGYARPEDVETGASTGTVAGGSDDVLYVAITGEDRVLSIDLDGPDGVVVRDYVKAGMNAPVGDFDSPDNLALDAFGNLYITEDPGSNFAKGKTTGDDVWRAAPSTDGVSASPSVGRFLSLNDCTAEPTGIYLDSSATMLFLNVQHRGGDGMDRTMVVTKN